MFRFARHDSSTAVPFRCTGIPFGERPRPRHGQLPTKREREPRRLRAADSRFSIANTSKHVCGSFSVNRCSRARTSRIRAKKPPTEVGGAVSSPSLPLIRLATLALTTLLATLPGLLLLLTRLLLRA